MRGQLSRAGCRVSFSRCFFNQSIKPWLTTQSQKSEYSSGILPKHNLSPYLFNNRRSERESLHSKKKVTPHSHAPRKSYKPSITWQHPIQSRRYPDLPLLLWNTAIPFVPFGVHTSVLERSTLFFYLWTFVMYSESRR